MKINAKKTGAGRTAVLKRAQGLTSNKKFNLQNCNFSNALEKKNGFTRQVLRFSFILFAIFAWSTGCVNNPESPKTEGNQPVTEAVFVLNEGLWGQDNASISVYHRDTGLVQHNVFQTQNPGLRLGDTAASMFATEELGFVVVNGSNTIEKFEMPTLKSKGHVLLPNNPSPRQMVVVEDSIAFVTALYTDAVLRVNLESGTIRQEIPVGPAPEGIVIVGNHLLVSNSGLGDIRAAEEGAGTLSIIDLNSLQEISRVPVLPNCTSLQIGDDGLLYVSGSGLYSADTTSGIVIFDPVQFAVLDTIIIPNHPRDFVIAKEGKGYILTDNAVVLFDGTTHLVENAQFITQQAVAEGAYLYAIAIDEFRQELFVSNARNFTTNGEVVCFDLAGNEKFRFETGISPGFLTLY
ncbi:hypothetical protein KC799_12420 [candidate division KSB1 bacterium]|nr:hypothetical protein [candidate division KSB1 bacterium]